LKRVGEANAWKRLIVAAGDFMIGGLDIDGGDVLIIGEQHDFIGVNLMPVFMRQLLFRNQARLQQPRDKGSGCAGNQCQEGLRR
jgi:hypothetical protein